MAGGEGSIIGLLFFQSVCHSRKNFTDHFVTARVDFGIVFSIKFLSSSALLGFRKALEQDAMSSSVGRSNISNTRKSVSSDIQTLRSGLKKRGAAEFFNQLRSVWISDETLFRVFDIASQSIDNSWRKSKQKFTEFYDN